MLGSISKNLMALGLLVVGFTSVVQADTIIKFPLGGGGGDFAFNGTTFGTIDDGDAATTGNQNTILEFTGLFDGLHADVNSNTASFTLGGVTATGTANVVGPIILQNTTGGTFSIYDVDNTLLLAGTLNNGVISGTMGAGSGSFFNTTFGSFTGGTLFPFLTPGSLEISIALTNIISDGNVVGFTVTNLLALNPFVADGSGVVAGTAVPEPITGALMLSGLLAGAGIRRKLKQ